MKMLFASFLFISMLSTCILSMRTCNMTYYKLGCYKDTIWSRTLNQLLFTDRDVSSHVTSGHTIDWWNWNDYLQSLICRCAEKSRSLGYSMFGLQYYGECWSGPGSCSSYNIYGESNKCIGQNMTACNIDTVEGCVGGPSTNYVYLLLEEHAR